MNKRADGPTMLEFVVRLVIALVMVITVIAIAKSCFRISSEATGSYTELVTVIDEIQEGELRSKPIILDKGTAIFGFSKNSEKISLTNRGIITKEDKPAITIDRPSACEKDAACLCLCSSKWGRKKALSFPHEMVCNGNIYCQNIDEIDFIQEQDLKDFGVDIKDFYSYFKLVGGFTFERYNKDFLDDYAEFESYFLPLFTGIKAINPREDLPSLHGSVSPIVFDERVRTIYIQRYQDKVAVCFNSPCITEEIKQELDAQT